MVLTSVLTVVLTVVLGSKSPSNGMTLRKMAATYQPGKGVRTDPQFGVAMSESTPAGAINWGWGGPEGSKHPKRAPDPLRGSPAGQPRTPLVAYRVQAGLASRMAGPDPLLTGFGHF